MTLFEEGFRDTAKDFTWKSWFEGDRLSFVGWRRAADGSIVGVELETVAFLAEFPSVLADAAGEGFVIEVRDGSGKALFKTGATPEEAPPDEVFTLSPVLPHRTLALWRMGASDIASGGIGVQLLAASAGGVIFLLFAAGVVVLVAEARHERRESERKTSFVSNVSHELKTPLTSIRLCAEMLSEGRAKDDAAKARYLGVITKESERLTRLVDNVLDFGRLEQNRRKYDFVDVDLRDVVRDAAESQRSRVEAVGMAKSRLSAPPQREAKARRSTRSYSVVLATRPKLQASVRARLIWEKLSGSVPSRPARKRSVSSSRNPALPRSIAERVHGCQ